MPFMISENSFSDLLSSSHFDYIKLIFSLEFLTIDGLHSIYLLKIVFKIIVKMLGEKNHL